MKLIKVANLFTVNKAPRTVFLVISHRNQATIRVLAGADYFGSWFW